MCSDMYIYMYMYTHMCTCACTHTRTYMHACVCVFVRACACVRVWQVHAIVGISAKRGRETRHTSSLLFVGVVSGSREGDVGRGVVD
jgi:hypothetical protein